MKIQWLVLCFPFLQACTLAVPVHQMMGPQTIGKGIEGGIVTIYAPSFGAEDENAPTGFSEFDALQGGRLAFSVAPNVDIEGELLAGNPFSEESVRSIAVKWQVLGNSLFTAQEGDTNLSIRAKYFRSGEFENDSDESNSNTIFDSLFADDLQISGANFGISGGKMLTNWFQLYGGGQYIQGNMDYKETDLDGVETFESRDISGYGPFFGMMFLTPGERFRFSFSLEGQYTNLPATFDDSRVWYLTYGGYANFAFSFD